MGLSLSEKLKPATVGTNCHKRRKEEKKEEEERNLVSTIICFRYYDLLIRIQLKQSHRCRILLSMKRQHNESHVTSITFAFALVLALIKE
jgi:hypothetical protein